MLKVSIQIDGSSEMRVLHKVVGQDLPGVLLTNVDFFQGFAFAVVHLNIHRGVRLVTFGLALLKSHGRLIFNQLLNLVRGVWVLSAVASDFVHLVVIVGPEPIAVLALELNNLLHDFEHQLVGFSHLVDLQADRALEVVLLSLLTISSKLLQAGLAGSGSALGALNNRAHLRNHRTDWALKVVRLDDKAAVLIQIVFRESELLCGLLLIQGFNHLQRFYYSKFNA